MKTKHGFFDGATALAWLLVVPVFLMFETQCRAIRLTDGELESRLDTTVSWGANWRVQHRDGSIVGTANGGHAHSVNADDGNLNYDAGLISNVFKMTNELECVYRNMGLFVRGTEFYDIENERSQRNRTPLNSEARELVGRDADLLDAYVWGSFDVGHLPCTVRMGEQVVSWGESTFIGNGINTINPINVSAFRLPGSELREALVPEGMVWLSFSVTDNLSFEALYLYDWEETLIDPPGSYWSTSDGLGEGGERIYLGWGDISDQGTTGLMGFDPHFLSLPRAKDDKADDQGQWGLACRIFAPFLNDMEFGLYFLRYHSRVPLVSFITGTRSGHDSAAAVFGLYPSAIPDPRNAVAGAIDAYARTGRYRLEYPEYINLFGISLNALLPQSGIALQGEISHRDDQPLQIDDVETVMALLSNLNDITGTIPFPIPYHQGQRGDYRGRYETRIPGYVLRNITQCQMTATQTFGPTLGADQLVMAGEIGMTYIHNMPSKNDLRLESDGTFTSGNDTYGPVWHSGKPAERDRYFADQTSYGYVLVSRMDFYNVFRSVNISPRVSWKHDFYGNTPKPLGNFLEGRKATGFGITAHYQQTWVFDISYTNFFGVNRHNLINDRDLITVNLKFSF